MKYSEKYRHDYNKEVGQRIRDARKEYGVTQKKMAEDIGVDSKYLSRIENGHSGCSIDLMMSIGDYTKKPVSYILGEEEKMAGANLPAEDQDILEKLSRCSTSQKQFISRFIDDLLASDLK